MAEEDKGVSPFPHPPSLFYKLYTDENVKAGKVPAPPMPVKGTYFMFGAKFDVRRYCFAPCLYLNSLLQTADAILRPLHEQNIKQLYPEVHGELNIYVGLNINEMARVPADSSLW